MSSKSVFLCLYLFCLTLFIVTPTDVKAQAGPKIKTLIIDGQNNHNWAGTTPVLKDMLEKSDRFTVEVATCKPEDTKTFGPDFSKYDLVVMNFNNDRADGRWNSITERAFEKFVADGGGLVVYHAADNSFPSWKAYNEMCAIGGWGGRNEKSGPYLYWENGKPVRNPASGSGGHHGPQWEFLIEVRTPEHPIMKGMPQSFRHAKDELYDFMRGPAENVTILATAFANTSHGGSGRHEPQLLAIDFGKGRVFHTCLGHDVPQIKSVSFIATFLRGAEWAATGKVTIPVPEDMPGTEKPVYRE